MQTPEIPGGSAEGSVLVQSDIPMQTPDSAGGLTAALASVQTGIPQGGLKEGSTLAPSVISRLKQLGNTIFIVTSANGKICLIFN